MTQPITVEAKIRSYYDLTQQETGLKKQKEPLSKEIKEHLRTLEAPYLLVDDLEASISQQTRGTTVNEAKLVAALKKLKRKDLIKKVEVPNLELIEKLIYDQELDASILSDCVESKVIEVISIKKAKKKKEQEDDAEN